MIVGLDIADDAAVYQISPELAIVVTLDFFTPIVDDPYAYGAIAAANSLSDIYAMGARPIMALNIAAVPKKLPLEVVSEIIRGGAEKAREAGIPVAGGHTIQDDEPKYGLVVIGMGHPQQITRKGGARPGDHLFLSKPLGTSVVATGLKRDLATVEEVQAATESMMQLNAEAAALAQAHGATAVTDITGFSLLGHASEMSQQSGVRFVFDFAALPWLPGAWRLGEDWVFPGGTFDNQKYFSSHVRFAEGIADWQQSLCFSPETSGGLLMSIPHEQADAIQQDAAKRGVTLWHVGEVQTGSGIAVELGD